MSRMLMSSMEIDLIVQVIVNGPDGVEGWRGPHGPDPDVLGSTLWARNWEAAARDDDGPMPEYRFTPPGVRLTALEGLRLLTYFEYQSADDEDRWRRGGVGAVVDGTMRSLITVLPGIAQLPWIWSRSDLEARRIEPEGPEGPTAPDPRIAELVQRYADAGVELTERSARLPFPMRDVPVVGRWTYDVPNNRSTPVITVYLARDDAAADVLVRMVRSRWGGPRPDMVQGTMRRGREVVAFDWWITDGTDRGERVWEQVAAIGPVDERWHCDDPPEFEVRGEVLATRVDVPVDRLSGTGAYLVARTQKDLAALADEIDDPEVRDLILRVDARRQSVIALPQFPDIESVGAIRSDLLVVGPGFQEVRTLRLDLGGARRRLMSVIAVDRLPRMPDQALITQGGVPVVGNAVRGVRDKG